MKRIKLVFICVLSLLLCLSAVGLVACGKKEELPDKIVNGGFEENPDASTWLGWTREGTAFSARGVVDDDEVNGVPVDKTGERWFSGLSGGTAAMTGKLRSDAFKLSGTGKIAFKMGAGKDGEKVYVEFVSGKEVLAKVTNADFDGTLVTDQLIRKVVDLSAHIGKEVQIVVTDDAKGDPEDYGYVNLDDFVVCATQADVDKYEAERESQLSQFAAPDFEEDETETTVRNGGFETGDLTNWKVVSGTAFNAHSSVVSTSQYYWTDRSVYGEGDYYLDGNNNGTIPEGATGAIRSTKFTLKGDGYISFMIGAGSSKCYVAICDGETDEELIKVENEAFKDPDLALTLLRVYVDASEYINKVLYIKVVDDNGGSGFAFINVDDFRCSLTEAEVRALELEQYRSVLEETYTSATYDDLAALRNYYINYEYPFPLPVVKITSFVQNTIIEPSASVDLTAMLTGAKGEYEGDAEVSFAVKSVEVNGETSTDGFDAFNMSAEGTYTVNYQAIYSKNNMNERTDASFKVYVQTANENQVLNGGFEYGDLTGWTVMTDGWTYKDGQAAGVISAQTYWGEEMPYNQSGSYHLDGWNTGIEEGKTWQVKSSVFTLGGSGWISVKMGGHAAAVKVFLEDGTQVGYYQQTRFSDVGFPSVAQGSWADMATYVMDLSEYIGQKMYIVLCDEQADGWAHAFFDEVVTYYETAPDYQNMSDTVTDGKPADGSAPAEVEIGWVLAENKYVGTK